MTETRSDHVLLACLKNGDDQAIETLYTRHAVRLYQYAVQRYHLSHEDADDAVQTTFWYVIEKITTYDEQFGAGGGWIYTICKNIIIDILRVKRPQDCSDVDPSLEDLSPEVMLAKYDHNQEIMRAWSKLTEMDRVELVRGRSRGPGRTVWHQAAQRFREAIYFEENPHGK